MQPYRTETFKLSPDPLLIEKVRDIVDVYLNPPDHALVLCVDEKSQIQALDSTPTAAALRARPSRAAHPRPQTSWNGSLFAALELEISLLIGQPHRRHRCSEFCQFLDVIEANVPVGLEAHIIVDDYGTHRTAIIWKWCAKRPRFYLGFTPMVPGST